VSKHIKQHKLYSCYLYQTIHVTSVVVCDLGTPGMRRPSPTEGGGEVCSAKNKQRGFDPLNAELNPIYYLLTLLGAHHILHVSRIRVKNHRFSVT